MKQTTAHRLFALLLAFVMVVGLVPTGALADPAADVEVWSVPVTLMHASQDKESMGNGAISGPATVTIDKTAGTAAYAIHLQPMEFAGLHGHLLNMWDYENFEENSATEAARPMTPSDPYDDVDLNGEPATFYGTYTAVRTFTEKEAQFYVRISVDAMAGFDQDARLAFDWANATQENQLPTETETWSVPVHMLKAGHLDQDSMGNAALEPMATVVLDPSTGTASYSIHTHGISFSGLYGHLLNLWHYEDYESNSATEAAIPSVPSEPYEDTNLSGEQATFYRTFTVTRDLAKEELFYIRISVDAMAGFDQDAALSFDWAKAEQVIEPQGPTFEFGPEKTVLLPGAYEIPVSMMKADNHEKPSMAASAIQGATMEVLEDGSAKITLHLGAVKIAIITGYSSDWEIFQEYNTTSETVKNEEVKDEKGHVTDSTFVLPFHDQDGVYAKMFVDAMNSYSDAFLAIDFAKAVRMDEGNEDQAKADEVIAMIENLGEISLDSADAIAAARKAYENLTDAQKELVTNLETLVKAEETLKALQEAAADQAKADEVMAMIENLGEISLDSADSIAAARKAYENLTDAQKELVTNLETLVKAEETLKALQEAAADQAKADEVIALIDKIGTVSLKSEPAIEAAREAYENLTDAQKKLVTNLETLVKAEEALEALKQAASDQEKADAVIELIDEIGTVTLDSEKDIQAARKAYENLTDAQKKLVTNLETLVKAEETLQALKDEITALDGNYYVGIALYKENKDEPSMGNVALENNPKALVTVENGKVTLVRAGTNPVQVGTFYSGNVGIEIEGVEVEVTETEPLTTKNGDKELGHYDYVKAFQFLLPESAQPVDMKGITFLPISFLVPDTPMGNDYMSARVRFDWENAEKTEDTVLVVSSEPGGDLRLPLSFLDPVTGIGMEATTQELPKDASMEVAQIKDGAQFETAETAMEGMDDLWFLYDIRTLSQDQEIAPKGVVTITVPCYENGLQVYRINPDGSKVVVRGEVVEDHYEFKTRTLGLFAIIGELDPEFPFTDVSETNWARKDIEFAYNHKLFDGMGHGLFMPKLAMNRAMFVTVLGRIYGVDPNGSVETPFTDVDADEYYAPYVAWAVENGIVKGMSETSFGPKLDVTREQMATFLVRYCEFAGITLADNGPVEFVDADQIHDWAEDAVDMVSRAGLINGMGHNNFDPRGNSTRAQVATLLARFVRAYGL